MFLVSSVKKLIEDLSSLCRTRVLSSRSPSAYESPSLARAREHLGNGSTRCQEQRLRRGDDRGGSRVEVSRAR